MCSALARRCGAVVSVGHRPTLARFHKWVLELSPPHAAAGGGGRPAAAVGDDGGGAGAGCSFRLIPSAQYLAEQSHAHN